MPQTPEDIYSTKKVWIEDDKGLFLVLGELKVTHRCMGDKILVECEYPILFKRHKECNVCEGKGVILPEPSGDFLHDLTAIPCPKCGANAEN